MDDVTDAEARFLAAATRQVCSTLDFETTLRNVASAALPYLGDWCVVDLLEDASIARLAVAHVDPEREVATRELAHAHTPEITATDGVATALRTRQAAIADVCQESLFKKLGATSGVISPLLTDEGVLGALSIGTQRQYAETDLNVVEEFASVCATAIDSARRFRTAQEAVEVRDAFLASVSHDLKNPLATIGGQAQLLKRIVQRGDTDRMFDRILPGAERIESAAQRMGRMIDVLLDVTRLELGGSIVLDRTRMDLVDVARRVAAEHQERTSEHRIVVAGETSLIGEWDLGRMERVLDNLIGNAIKYSPAGGTVTVICVKESDDADAWAVLSVRDEGVGIPPADVPRVFDRFHRAGNVGKISGTGVGLATIQEIVAQHGGTITVDSSEGLGSTFTIRLPIG